MKLVYPQIVTGADFLRGIHKLNVLAPLLQRRGVIAASIVNESMVGVPSFYQVMKKHHIHPVIGLTVQLNIQERKVALYIYAKSEKGYHNLLKMSSAISITPERSLPLAWLKAYGDECFVVCAMTDASWEELRQTATLKLILENHPKEMTYVGVARPGGQVHHEEEQILQVAEECGLAIQAVYESRYTLPEHCHAFLTAQAIRENTIIQEVDQVENAIQYAYLPTSEELTAWFEGRLEWLEETEKMLTACQVDIKKSTLKMPRFPVGPNEEANQLLAEKCRRGLEAKIGEVPKRYLDRLQHELKVIQEMGYADYFLIVEDFMAFAAAQHILTGPGRGSSAGSLVAYALNITEVDPLVYDLIFERFLNPQRVTMPDIDIDFEDYRRQEVIHYVAEKYGKAYVAQIGTYGTLSARAVARDVARVYGFSNEKITYIADLLPNRPNARLRNIYQESSELRQWVLMKENRKKWFETALLLEGLPRNSSKHAAGLILSPVELVQIVPLTAGDDKLYVTQWAMDEVEAQGLLKMDFLGLRNLTLLNQIIKLLKRDRKAINLHDLPLNDAAIYQLFQAGKMTGIFQFESSGMRETLQQIQPTRFEDLYTINALYRPGPMDFIPQYQSRREGKQAVHYLHPLLEPILKETYGIIVYQEQVIQILVQMAGYSLGEADIIRRAMTSHDEKVMARERKKFVKKAVANQIPFQTATEVYALIERFADYSFPKSHAVAYSLISYRLAYLKVHAAPYFYAAYLNSVLGNEKKMNETIREAKELGISVLPPSVATSNFDCTVEGGAIRLGLKAIQGVTFLFYQQLERCRKVYRKPMSFFTFAEFMGRDLFTKKNIEPLIKAGALDHFGQAREVLLASIDVAISHIKFSSVTLEAYEEDPQQFEESTQIQPVFREAAPLSTMEKLSFEKEVLGFYISEHPVVGMKKMLKQPVAPIQALRALDGKQFVNVLGLIIDIRTIRTKKGDAMAFVTIQDESNEISCTFFPRQYDLYKKDLRLQSPIRIQGTVEKRRGVAQIIVQNMHHISAE